MMVIKKLMVLKTQFDYVSKRLSSLNMLRVLNSIWVFFCSYLFFVFGFISQYILIRFQVYDHRNHQHVVCFEHHHEFDTNREEKEEDVYLDFPIRRKSDDQNRAETEDSVSAMSTDLYEYTSNIAINGYMEEPKAMSFTVQEFYANSGSSKLFVHHTTPIKTAEEDHERAEELETREHEKPVTDQKFVEEFSTGEVLDAEIEPCEVEEEAFSSRKDEDVGSLNYEFLIYRNVVQYDDGVEHQSSWFHEEEDQRVHLDTEDDQLLSACSKSSDDEYVEMLEPELGSCSQRLDQVEEKGEEHKEELVQFETTTLVQYYEEEENVMQEKKPSLFSDDENESEFYEEHDDLIERMKREIKNVRTGGLPTISEEDDHSVSTKMVENLKLKPLKIDEKLEYKDRIVEIQKMYKSYAEKMRKLDILNNQTMHAIGLLQLKDQVKPISMQKPSNNPIMKSLLSQNLLRRRAQRRTTVDPMPKFVGDLHKDSELVYVGQVCLSWEILHWQYRRAQELQQYDNHRHYNSVATEFQLFQVLLQRFIEDDPFQGPRVQHYVRNRCVLRSLLQVPAIRDDCRKEKMKHGTEDEEEESIIGSVMLAKIIEESMRIYWDFLHSDKRSSVLKSLSLQECQVAHKDLELLMEIRKDLQKKEKKLKDIERSGNCVVRKFQKQHEDQGRVEYSLFVAQVEMRLLLRVMNMSRLTPDQLLWCHEKLDNINFADRKPLAVELLMEIRKDLQKKEKRLKDIERSGNCVVRKFQNQHEDQGRIEHSLFVAQVQMWLVSRVMNMSRITLGDLCQLLWCHEKLDNINFVDSKVVIEASFLFPC